MTRFKFLALVIGKQIIKDHELTMKYNFTAFITIG